MKSLQPPTKERQMNNTAELSKAFTALLVGPRAEDCDTIVRALSDRWEICHSAPSHHGWYVLAHFCGGILEDRLDELKCSPIPVDDDHTSNENLTLDDWDKTVRSYCAAIRFDMTDQQRLNLISLFQTYLYKF